MLLTELVNVVRNIPTIVIAAFIVFSRIPTRPQKRDWRRFAALRLSRL
jgi:hypothetical protein